MPVEFARIEKGTAWNRKQLAELWGFRSFHALARGVFTPANSNLIVLFVTEKKQPSLQQYDDRLLGNILFWEGEDRHQSDLRISSSAARGDRIHVFYRREHHSAFTYLGTAIVLKSRLMTEKPSEFELRVE